MGKLKKGVHKRDVQKEKEVGTVGPVPFEWSK